MSGVGISYGAERIYDVLNELNLFPTNIDSPVKVLFINFGANEELYALKGLQALRQAGIASELYPEKAKIGKQMTYANAKAVPFVIMAGADEMAENVYTLKDMNSGEQQKLNIEEICKEITAKI